MSEAAKAILSLCWYKGEPRNISPIFGNNYTINGVSFKFTNELLDEIKQSNKVKICGENSKSVVIMGL